MPLEPAITEETAEPGRPSELVEPAVSGEAVESTQSPEPTEPAVSGETAESTQPSEPMEPAVPEETAVSTESSPPVEAAASEVTQEPTRPSEPEISTDIGPSEEPGAEDVDEIVETEAIDEEASPAAPDPEAAIREVIASWAGAWSGQDVNAYLSHYAGNFVPSGKLDRSAWEKQRKQRLTAPASIDIQLSDIEITITEDGGASAVFNQAYKSPRYSDRVRKRLEFVFENGAWKISREESF
ncbi:MAG TPA: hypothetical protein ENI99_12210 [Sedimenticola sp.]|nr:hypothetical protein [Sedimenticola sp.]